MVKKRERDLLQTSAEAAVQNGQRPDVEEVKGDKLHRREGRRQKREKKERQLKGTPRQQTQAIEREEKPKDPRRPAPLQLRLEKTKGEVLWN